MPPERVCIDVARGEKWPHSEISGARALFDAYPRAFDYTTEISFSDEYFHS